ncbi:MAG: urocanate hydratase [Euryarchaeota archaeon]|jgi:urocanate hydratase|nr:urocanate hydratase [Euryarchaeota archaeon]MBT5844433.1 urocanate hydratase [Euryarchaeota archaeon]MBT6641366.1 urocanate hydratase [Euryarchaeota archaeon]MBT6844603.1 urocanate hydratase [Euryarchaeota archaeon]MBT7263728.1 urocanate hydratase [Euryarchaeota archaeon]
MGGESSALRISLGEGIPENIPSMPEWDDSVDHAPPRRQILSPKEKQLALRNALRYFPKEQHIQLAGEFLDELNTFGRIIMWRYRPTSYQMRAHPIDSYPAKCRQAASIMLMIQNNLDPAVAQFPHELITYGGNGSVFQNWAQYRLVMKYLSQMTETQTLVIYSGHPLGLFPSTSDAPRVIITNGMVIPNASSQENYERMNALGVTQYGQMTAGSYMYIGPQGIVHGTTITLLNAARAHLGLKGSDGLEGVTFVTSGLGGMSGAQAKAAVIAGATCIVAESNPHAAHKRHRQGWLSTVTEDIDEAIDLMVSNAEQKSPISIGYIGNIVDLWERLVERGVSVDLGSDQTSLHNPFQGGYFPVGHSYDDATSMLSDEPERFADEVRSTLRRHANAIHNMTLNGMYFWDYGNAFLLEASRAGADVLNEDGSFRYPSYVEDIMGPMCFDYGFGPYRWVCCSGKPEDLQITDEIACQVLEDMLADSPVEIQQQMVDNIHWIRGAGENNMVVGSQARILYADDEGRRKIASAMNSAIANGRLSGPVVLGRDHHDVSGTDSPYRETANIQDGSMHTADMAVQNFVGDAFRGATWVSLHNGGGVGWGEVMNGGFGMLLDGSDECEEKLQRMLHWDVNNGVARRAWARNKGAEFAIQRAMESEPLLQVTLPHHMDEGLLKSLFHEGEQ